LKININKETVPAEKLNSLKTILKKFEGRTPVYLTLSSSNSKIKVYSLDSYRVNTNSELLKSLTDLFGEESVILSHK